MDKPLGAIRGITLGVALLAVALYAALGMSSGRHAFSMADCLRTIQQTECLMEDQAVLLRSIKVNQEIYDRLLEERLSLSEAATALQEEIENRPLHLHPPIYPHERNLPPEERYMLRFLIWIGNHLHGDPRREEVMTRLRAQLQAYRAARTRPVPTDSPKCQAVVASRAAPAP